jgi:hypothetical protein
MARNKHPEITEEKILEISKRLFIEKGYDATKIQDTSAGMYTRYTRSINTYLSMYLYEKNTLCR